MDSTAAYELVQDALLSPQDRISTLLASLPVLPQDSVDLEDPCPICLMPFAAVFAESEDPSKENVDLAGVTKLAGCGHIFCRRDLTEWIRSQHGSCPTCRHTFLDIRPLSESDDESSDGGEYIPNPDELDDDDEDALLDADAYTDTDAEDFPVQGMDMDPDEIWAEHQLGQGDVNRLDPGVQTNEDQDQDDMEIEWGLTDGESESMSSLSEAGSTMDDDDDGERDSAALEMEVSVSVHDDGEDAIAEQGDGLIPHDPTSQDPK